MNLSSSSKERYAHRFNIFVSRHFWRTLRYRFYNCYTSIGENVKSKKNLIIHLNEKCNFHFYGRPHNKMHFSPGRKNHGGHVTGYISRAGVRAAYASRACGTGVDRCAAVHPPAMRRPAASPPAAYAALVPTPSARYGSRARKNCTARQTTSIYVCIHAACFAHYRKTMTSVKFS